MASPGEPRGFPTDPTEFDADDRISYSTVDDKFILVQENGDEFEFNQALKRWISVVDEALLQQQQRAYAVEGVDETQPVNANRKRKKEYVNGEQPKAQKKSKPVAPKQNTAVYVTGLPLDVTVDEVKDVFSRKCGVIAEEIDSGRPRIKLYSDDDGSFKGDALIVFFKPQSVDMAIMLLDDTEFRISPTASGRMRVQPADSTYKKTQYTEGEERPKQSNRDKQKVIKRTQKLDAKLADWSDDEPAYESTSRWDKVVILKHMFTLQELEEDPAALLDIKEDVRDECSKLGHVTNVILYDLEADGVISVRFSTVEAADACVQLMNGRSFAGQAVEAYIATGRENFQKSSNREDE